MFSTTPHGLHQQILISSETIISHIGFSCDPYTVQFIRSSNKLYPDGQYPTTMNKILLDEVNEDTYMTEHKKNAPITLAFKNGTLKDSIKGKCTPEQLKAFIERNL